MTLIGVCEFVPARVDALRFPSYNYRYHAFKNGQLDKCVAQAFSRRPPMFRRVDAGRLRRYDECRHQEDTVAPGTSKEDLDALGWVVRTVCGHEIASMPQALPISPRENLDIVPNLNAKEYTRWRFETTPVVTTRTRGDWNHFLNRCPERFNIALPMEISEQGRQPQQPRPYYDGGYALRYMRPDLKRGLWLDPWFQRTPGIHPEPGHQQSLP